MFSKMAQELEDAREDIGLCFGPRRMRYLLDRPPAPWGVQVEKGWNPRDSSPNMYVKACDKLTCWRDPEVLSTDCIRGKFGYTNGIHAWEIFWPKRLRGSHAAVGVATSEAPLHTHGYCCLVGRNEHSWGWDIGRKILLHNTNNNTGIAYPDNKPAPVPDRFLVVLDMDEGTLSFAVSAEKHLGVAFTGLKGKTLYPMISVVWGYAQIRMKYIGGLDPEPWPLIDLCRFIIRERVGKEKLREKISELRLPRTLEKYMLYQDGGD